MFDPTDRDRVRDRVLALAGEDARVVAGAVVGSLADGGGDRWSDLDLTFSVADDASVDDVLGEWTAALETELDAVHLFDLRSGPSIYRVFLLPGLLQFDLSFTPAAEFRARGPKFELLFGDAREPRLPPPPDPRNLFGHGIHHALRARFCVERGRVWQAALWIGMLRDQGLALACRSRGLPAHYGRGHDDLPDGVRESFRGAFPSSLDPAELRRSLRVALDGLFAEVEGVGDVVARVEAARRELVAEWPAE